MFSTFPTVNCSLHRSLIAFKNQRKFIGAKTVNLQPPSNVNGWATLPTGKRARVKERHHCHNCRTMATTPSSTASPPLEHHIINAALVTTRPTSSPTERAEASFSLQQWTSSSDPSVWGAYVNIIKSFGDTTGSWGSDHSSSSVESNIVEKIAYVTSPSKAPSPNLDNQIRQEAVGAKLLLITLLSTKIRSEYLRLVKENPMVARGLYEVLLTALMGLGEEQDKSLMSALSMAVAAVVVRSSSTQFPNEGAIEMISQCKTSIATSLGMSGHNGGVTFPPIVALKLLSDIPGEVASRTDLTSTDVQQFFVQPVNSIDITSAALETLQFALSGFITAGGEQSDSLLCLTLTALTKWTEGSKSASVSHLNEVGNGVSSILSQLVALLSTQLQQKQWSSAGHAQSAITESARALSASIINTSDCGTQSRKLAVASLLASIQTIEFLTGALKIAQSQQWEDAIIAVSTLASSLAREDIEDIAQCQHSGCLELFELLLELQSHDIHNAAVPVLDVWLALQDIPTPERHPSLVAPLYMRLVEVVLNRVAYPSNFVSWEEELELESSEFEEMRRLSTDVLIGAYELLRSDYLETLSTVVTSTDRKDWAIIESALFCLCAVAREACARVKSAQNAAKSGRDSPAASDGSATATGLTQMVASLCEGGSASTSNQHPLVLSAIGNFLGSYSVVWSTTCPAPSILEMLSYLATALSVPAAVESAGKGIRLVLIASVSKLVKATSSPGADPSAYNQISTALTQCMNSALSTGNSNVMASVAEGCSRLAVQLGDKSQSRTILSNISHSTIKRARDALDAMVSSSSVEGSGQAASQSDAASQVLASCLGVLRELVRFCDGVSSLKEGQPHVVSDMLNSAWPVLNEISNQKCCRSNEMVLSGLLEVHSQLLSVVPCLIGPYFKDLISFVVRAYEESTIPSALDYVSAAVESFGSEHSDIASSAGFDDNAKESMFNQLLSHLCKCTFTYVTETKRPSECPHIISALFKMAQRYLLFCPVALTQCPEFASLFSLAVSCLTECKGEVESTRSSLIYLNQLIGWKYIRLTGSRLVALKNSANDIDNLLVQHGESIVEACLNGMSGPQMLWPSFSECVFSIMIHVAESSSALDESSLLHKWLCAAINGNVISQNITPDVGMTIVKLLCEFSQEGVKSKPRAKMLLMDYGKICKGETGKDALLAYSLA